MSKLFIGPWVGEFGVELLYWQSYGRAVARERGWDEVIVATRPDRFFLYEDYATQFVPYDPRAEDVLVHLCEGHVYNNLHRQFIDERNGDTWLSPVREDLRWNRIQWELERQRIYVDYSQFGQKPATSYDVLIHARATDKCGQTEKNWPVKSWEALVEALAGDYRIASIGARNGAHKIRGTTDLRGISLKELAGHMGRARLTVGPSSGPMHFAVFSACAVLTWVEPVPSWTTVNEPYRTPWNPFAVPLACLLTWRPSVEIVAAKVREMLLLIETRGMPVEHLVFGTKRSGHHAVLEWIARLDELHDPVHWNDCVVNDIVSFPRARYVITQNWSAPKSLSRNSFASSLRRLSEPHRQDSLKGSRMLSFEETPIQDVIAIPETADARRIVFVVRDVANCLASLRKGIPELARKRFHDRPFRRFAETIRGYLREALGRTDYLGALRDKAVFISFNRWHLDPEYRREIAYRLGFGRRDADRSIVAEYGGGTFEPKSVDASTMDVLGRWQGFADNLNGFWAHVEEPELRELERLFHGDSLPALGRMTCRIEDDGDGGRNGSGECPVRVVDPWFMNRASQPGAEDYPARIDITLTTRCNIVPPCVMCGKLPEYRRTGRMPGEDIDRRVLEELEPFFAHCKMLQLNGFGEPLMSRRLFDVISMLPPSSIAAFKTNGLLLTEDICRKLVISQRVGRVDISVDAATPETYRKIRRNDFEVVKGNIRRLVAIRASAPFPKVYINAVLMRENVAEAPLIVTMAKELGAERVTLSHIDPGRSFSDEWFDYSAQHCRNDPELHDRAIEMAVTTAQQLGVPLQIEGVRAFGIEPRPIAPRASDNGRSQGLARRPFRCPTLFRSMAVESDGEVKNCCSQRGTVGNLYREGLLTLWFSKMKAMRDAARHGEIPAICTAGNCCFLGGRD